MNCPAIRPELEALPAYMRDLPVDDRGYVVPWFVAYVDGKPEFRAMDNEKWISAVKNKRCWVCGKHTGRKLVFVLGPMCGINRTTSEPPCHEQCARWSARNCPFLTLRMQRRRENDMPEHVESAGCPIRRNPGVVLLWFCERYQVFRDPKGRPLIEVGDPKRTEWYAHGRTATREEIEASINSGLPSLRGLCFTPGDHVGLDAFIARFHATVSLD
ncbi:MAG: hypothetical protein WCD38_11655 [Candidatus Tumulicola sp.]